jgi:hypothetical protein
VVAFINTVASPVAKEVSRIVFHLHVDSEGVVPVVDPCGVRATENATISQAQHDMRNK